VAPTASAVSRRAFPQDMTYRPKWKIALEEVDRARANQVRLDWLTFDEEYGKAPEFVCGLDQRTVRFVGEVAQEACRAWPSTAPGSGPPTT